MEFLLEFLFLPWLPCLNRIKLKRMKLITEKIDKNELKKLVDEGFKEITFELIGRGENL